MDEFATGVQYAVDESTLRDRESNAQNEHRPDAHRLQQSAQQEGDTSSKARAIRDGLVRAVSLQDKMLEKLLTQMVPLELPPGDIPSPLFPDRPAFSLSLMMNNFLRFNARVGVLFKFQARVQRVLAWDRPTETWSLLAVYTLICLRPYLLLALPFSIIIFGILVPSFIARHPAPMSDTDRLRSVGFSPRGPPLAPAPTVALTKETSKDFLQNLGGLQNMMDDLSNVHDAVVDHFLPVINFSDEALSSAVFVWSVAGLLFVLAFGDKIPIRFIALIAGWAGILSLNPWVRRWAGRLSQQFLGQKDQTDGDKDGQKARNGDNTNEGKSTGLVPIQVPSPAELVERVKSDIKLDSPPETREVEVFELQRKDPATGEWEAWLFTPTPYDPLSAARLAGERPKGERFFEDVLPPEGWEWADKKWVLDLWSREWVEERIITSVEVETEGERWVYDLIPPNQPNNSGEEDLAEEGGLANGSARGPEQRRVPGGFQASWEEAEDDEGAGRRGNWRRRRWVRTVKRKAEDIIDRRPIWIPGLLSFPFCLMPAKWQESLLKRTENVLDFAEPVVHNLRYYYLTSWMADNQSKVGHFLRQITYKPRQNRRFKRLSLIWDVGSALWTHWGRPTWKKIGVPYCLRMLRGRDQQEADRIYNETIDMLQRGNPEGEERLRFVVQGIVTGYLLCNRETMILAMEIMESKGW